VESQNLERLKSATDADWGGAQALSDLGVRHQSRESHNLSIGEYLSAPAEDSAESSLANLGRLQHFFHGPEAKIEFHAGFEVKESYSFRLACRTCVWPSGCCGDRLAGLGIFC
jgi:hypothetical protein